MFVLQTLDYEYETPSVRVSYGRDTPEYFLPSPLCNESVQVFLCPPPPTTLALVLDGRHEPVQIRIDYEETSIVYIIAHAHN